LAFSGLKLALIGFELGLFFGEILVFDAESVKIGFVLHKRLKGTKALRHKGTKRMSRCLRGTAAEVGMGKFKKQAPNCKQIQNSNYQMTKTFVSGGEKDESLNWADLRVWVESEGVPTIVES
jgi:hypothetical protein